MNFKTISFDGETVRVLDQTLLPFKEVYRKLSLPEEMADAIRRLVVRGAPLIGVSAAYGVVLSALAHRKDDMIKFKRAMLEDIKLLADTRPTAVNLFYALGRMENVLHSDVTTVRELVHLLTEEAERIHREDMQMCCGIGNYGEPLIPDGGIIMTQCNAGALATSGMGTALAPVYRAREGGKDVTVYVPETRPLLQGARLTAWELSKNGIPVTIICDSARGWVLKSKKVDLCIVGADRIAKNGDTANKIGTYSLAVLAKRNGVPFWVAAPKSTFDEGIETGRDIPIEERDGDEVRGIADKRVAPDERVFNPAFDVTEASLITGFITDEGIVKSA
ncbi:S-methyl-5-thioribose-1-phosphate isomerase [candidate division WOR-3 bacterium JGI_Cruoil_03_44_89]|uniref:Methylthioribose-1-phosphate isomerase n=1 Tax=candidate division WOR-3 bacterium JGI_Cruoil_03_44_89 TaxID=1973748 RepID=A0A235BYR0_UNCW3|nr:MAG: S-methyl-5-thioribose-1-phosphate isomerase [candidate division WOR-3 bacterium JGI_Cruoil_03_44_89]